MYCPNCSAENKDAAKFCKNCGQPLRVRAAPARRKRFRPALVALLMLAVVSVVAGVVGYRRLRPPTGKFPYTAETPAAVQHTFEAATGTDWNTGIGLKVSVPPAPTEGKVELAVSRSAPEQLEEEFIALHSIYDISLVSISTPEEHSPVTLTFEIPEGVDPRSTVILQWTEEGWALAECKEGLPGGAVSADGKYVSIVREQLSKYAIAEWLYKHIFRHFENLPEPPPPSPIIEVGEAKPSSLYPGYLVVEVALESPTIWRGLGGTWYEIVVRGEDLVKVEGSGYLAPGEKRNLEILFRSTGGQATVCLNTEGALPRATLDWANRLGVPGSEAEFLVEIVERFRDRPADWKDLVWMVKNVLVKLVWEVLGSIVKFYANVVPVSIDIATYINALTDHRPDPCVDVSAEGATPTPTLTPTPTATPTSMPTSTPTPTPTPTPTAPLVSPWPMYRHDAQRTGCTSYIGPEVPELKWTFRAGGPISSPVIGADGTIYVGSEDGNLYALDPSGSKKWVYGIAGKETSQLAVAADGTIYVARGSNLYAFRPDGTFKWTYSSDDEGYDLAIGPDGTIYIAGECLHAVSPDGKGKWVTGSEKCKSFGALATGQDGTIYGMTILDVCAFSPDGALKWEEWTAPGVRGYNTSITLDLQGNIYVNGEAAAGAIMALPIGALEVLDPDGSYRFDRFKGEGFDGYIESPPAMAQDGTVYVGWREVGEEFETEDGRITAKLGPLQLQARSPDAITIWSYLLGGVMCGYPVVGGDGTVYVALCNGDIYAFDSGGSLKWKFNIGESILEGGHWSAWDLAIGAGTLYISSGNKLYAIGEASLPVSITNVELVGQIGGHIQAVAVQGDYAYIGEWNRLVVVDISNPANPVKVGQTEKFPDVVEGILTADVQHVFVRGSYAYVLTWHQGLWVVDVSNPNKPQRLGHSAGLYDVFVSGSYAYVADGDGLRVIDVSDPFNPHEVGYYDRPLGDAVGIFVSGPYAYVADRYGGLRVLDISKPASPQEMGHCDVYSSGIFVSGAYAYVVERDLPYIIDGIYYVYSLAVMDISNPANPQKVGYFKIGFPYVGWPLSLFVSGSYVYLAGGEEGLWVIDISDPANPRKVCYYDTPGIASEVFVSGQYAYVADGDGGLLILRLMGRP